MLFEVDSFPDAIVSAELEVPVFTDLGVGERLQTTIDAQLSLHGIKRPVALEAAVTRISQGQWSIVSRRPTIILGTEFGLGDGIDALRQVAGLTSITPAVAVSFELRVGAED